MTAALSFILVACTFTRSQLSIKYTKKNKTTVNLCPLGAYTQVAEEDMNSVLSVMIR